jgi:hypothetical protein
MDQIPANPPPVEPTSTPAPAAPPPAAALVNDSPPLEEVGKLRADLEEERRLRKERELSLTQALDENRSLKQAAVPPPTPRAPKKSAIEAFMDGDD